jgi:Cu2+-exporting ATPase
MVQVMAARRLFEKGILLKDGGALERLAEIDTVVFDKTGTLTLGTPRLVNAGSIDPGAMHIAAAIASHSLHPYSRAVTAAAGDAQVAPVAADAVSEIPGSGLEARLAGGVYRLGRPAWAVVSSEQSKRELGAPDVALSRDGQLLAGFSFDDRLRTGAIEALADLKGQGLAAEILSGDRTETVRRIAASLGVPFAADIAPADKVARVAKLSASGHRVLMVGDGLNDAPALVAAHASMAPASAADIGRNAADLVFLHEGLGAVPYAVRIARSARHLVRQNLALAVAYNAIAVPLAVCGFVTPLVAAIAMSLSSLIVVANAMRLRDASPRRPTQPVRPEVLAQPAIEST